MILRYKLKEKYNRDLLNLEKFAIDRTLGTWFPIQISWDTQSINNDFYVDSNSSINNNNTQDIISNENKQ